MSGAAAAMRSTCVAVERLYGPAELHLPGLDIGRSYCGTNDAFRYGGDVVDAFHYGAGYTSLAVIDVTGHGVAAAPNARLVKHALRAYASRGFNARDCVRALNRLCSENGALEGDGSHATLFFAIVDPDRRAMHYVSAGHDAAFLIARKRALCLEPTGPILALTDDDAAFDHRRVRLEAGDILAAVTDGFSEARNASRAFLGGEALVDVIARNRLLDPVRQADAVTRRAYDYSNGRLHDDVAALVVKVL
jgi:serine phosphatase RsbU (regulator of sigma subunit)